MVPGVDVFSYLVSAVTEEWGSAWLEHGALDARFLRPVCDGDTITLVAELGTGAGVSFQVSAVDQSGQICASGRAERNQTDPPPDPARWPDTRPSEKFAANPESLDALRNLPSLTVRVSEADARQQLTEVRESCRVFEQERLIHPGHLLRFADAILSNSVELPPWMHVSSRVRLFGKVHWDATLSVRARRLELFEKKGHRFIQLDVLISTEDRPAMRVQPYTAIYDPAWNRSGSQDPA